MQNYKINVRFASRLAGLFLTVMVACGLNLSASNNEESNGYDFVIASDCSAGSARYQGNCYVYLSSSQSSFTLASWDMGDAYVYQKAKANGDEFNTLFVEAGSYFPSYQENFTVDGDEIENINLGNIAGYTHPGIKATLALWSGTHGVSADIDEDSHTYHF